MMFLHPSETEAAERVSTFQYVAVTDQPILTYDVSACGQAYILFRIKGRGQAAAPQIFFDIGHGFSDASMVRLKPLDVAVYLLPLAAFPNLKRIRIEPFETPTPFSLAVLKTECALLAGILFKLLNRPSPADLAPRQKRSLVARVQKLVRDAPAFFRWVRSSQSFYASSEHDSVLDFVVAMRRLAKKESEAPADRPVGDCLLSIVVPCYNADPTHLHDLVESFTSQNADFCELIIADDGSHLPQTIAALNDMQGRHDSVRLILGRKNGGISVATNAGIAIARGRWVTFMDHDDALAPFSLHVIGNEIQNFPTATLFYTDEYIADRDLKIVGLSCKPAFDSVLLSGMNYVNHLSIYRADILNKIGLLNSAFDGSQDYDLLLRYSAEIGENAIVHIPFPAYIWRRTEVSYSVQFLDKAVRSARVALEIHYKAQGTPAQAGAALDPSLHRLQFAAKQTEKVCVIIPNKDSFSLIARLCDQLVNATAYEALDIIVVDNGSTDPDVLAFYEQFAAKHQNFRASIKAEPFNFSRMCNRGASETDAPLMLFLNNDIEILEPLWLPEMVQCLAYPHTGIVGAKLLYPDRTVQHNGVIVGLGSYAGHWYVGRPENDPGPMGRFYVRQTLTAVTGACFLVTRPCFDAVGGFDEAVFPVAYNDIDFCLKAHAKGLRTIWTPFAKLMHHESQSRGLDDRPENIERFNRDKASLQDRYGTDSFIDDAYSPLYGRHSSMPTLNIPPRRPAARVRKFV